MPPTMSSHQVAPLAVASSPSQPDLNCYRRSDEATAARMEQIRRATAVAAKLLAPAPRSAGPKAGGPDASTGQVTMIMPLRLRSLVASH